MTYTQFVNNTLTPIQNLASDLSRMTSFVLLDSFALAALAIGMGLAGVSDDPQISPFLIHDEILVEVPRR